MLTSIIDENIEQLHVSQHSLVNPVGVGLWWMLGPEGWLSNQQMKEQAQGGMSQN